MKAYAKDRIRLEIISFLVFELNPEQFGIVRPLFQPLDHYLVISSVLERHTPGRVFVDSMEDPRSAMLSMGRRNFIAGAPDDAGFNHDVGSLLVHEIYPAWIISGGSIFVLNYSPGWEDRITEIFPVGISKEKCGQTYEHRFSVSCRHARVPKEFDIQEIDERLLAQVDLGNLDALKAEMCSERATIGEFYSRSFGVCLLRDGEILGWCLSEYNCRKRCELGIEVAEKYRRLGLGKLLCGAFIEAAQSRGIERIGWHCWKENTASAATALASGFRLVCENPVRCVMSDMTK